VDASVKSLLLHPHAKINLGLRILGLRSDGHHEIRTRFQTVSLTDELEIRLASQGMDLRVEGAALAADGSNLVIRAAEAMRSCRRGLPGARMRLRKVIPLSAGLGGGSSDAAATLLGLDRLWELNLSPVDLLEMAAGLGSDVPFFLQGGTALGEGRGDLIRPLPDLPFQRICLVLPPYGSATSETYRRWEVHPHPAPPGDETGETYLPGDPGKGEGPKTVRNDLQGVVFADHPELEEILDAFYRAGATAASLSGSGSSLFGLFPSPEEVRRFRNCRDWPPFRVIECAPVGRREYRTALGLDPAPHPGTS
jgi:4-diphosphocytidyl-2-C-methyl-D-erythritol kinase